MYYPYGNGQGGSYQQQAPLPVPGAYPPNWEGERYPAPDSSWNWQAYRTQDYNNYGIANYGVTRDMIDSQARELMSRYDPAGTGQLPLSELLPLLNEFMWRNRLPPVSPNDAWALMHRFDYNGRGAVNFPELEMMLATLGGYEISPLMLGEYRALPIHHRHHNSWRHFFGY